MGYDENFLGDEPVPIPDLAPRLRADAVNGGAPIEHTRFSVVFSRARGLALCTAHMIDGATMLPEGHIPRRDRFRFDDQVDPALQIDDDRGYRNNPWDRGHLARRRSLHWGDEDEARTADHESYFWTNIAPQHERLHDTAWGPIEDWMLERAEGDDVRAAVFTGPVLTEDDPLHQNAPNELPFQVPAGFWKVVVVPRENRRTVACFLVWQRDHDSVHPVTFSPFLEQVRLTTIEFLTGLSFPTLRALDPQQFRTGPTRRGLRIPTRSAIRNAIFSPADIVL